MSPKPLRKAAQPHWQLALVQHRPSLADGLALKAKAFSIWPYNRQFNAVTRSQKSFPHEAMRLKSPDGALSQEGAQVFHCLPSQASNCTEKTQLSGPASADWTLTAGFHVDTQRYYAVRYSEECVNSKTDMQVNHSSQASEDCLPSSTLLPWNVAVSRKQGLRRGFRAVPGVHNATPT